MLVGSVGIKAGEVGVQLIGMDEAFVRRERKYLMASVFHSAGFVHGDVAGLCRDDSLEGAQQGGDDSGIGLGAAGEKEDIGPGGGAGFPDHILENYGFDYCVVTAIGRDGDNVVMTLDNTGCYDDVNTVIWKNAEILELEDGVVGGRWMDHELYQVSGGYEFHSILEGENGQLCYLTLKAEDVSFIFDEKKREASEEAE